MAYVVDSRRTGTVQVEHWVQDQLGVYIMRRTEMHYVCMA